MHFSLVKYTPNGQGSLSFDDILLPLYFALQRLGYKTEILVNCYNPHSRNILFGTCAAPRKMGRRIPHKSIIFNVEQLSNSTSTWNNKDYFAHLSDYTVWEYSERNIEYLTRIGVTNIAHVPFGYVDEMTRLERNRKKDIDVFFYGALNDRRKKILAELANSGIDVLLSTNVFGAKRDEYLSRSKLVLNIHYYSPAVFEAIRLGYVFANHIPVVAEWRDDTEIAEYLKPSCAFFPSGCLVEGIKELLSDENARMQQAEKGFTAFSSVSLRDTLQKVVGKRTHAVSLSQILAVPEWLILPSQNIPEGKIPLESPRKKT